MRWIARLIEGALRRRGHWQICGRASLGDGRHMLTMRHSRTGRLKHVRVRGFEADQVMLRGDAERVGAEMRRAMDRERAYQAELRR